MSFPFSDFYHFPPQINQSFFSVFPVRAGRWRASSSNQLPPCLSRTMFSRVLLPMARFHGFSAAASSWSCSSKSVWESGLRFCIDPMRRHLPCLSLMRLREHRAATHPCGSAERKRQPSGLFLLLDGVTCCQEAVWCLSGIVFLWMQDEKQQQQHGDFLISLLLLT